MKPAPLSTLTCPFCGNESKHTMPENACVVVLDCPACAATVHPRIGDCCVFCSFGSVPCPPIQLDGKAGCCG